MIEKSMRSVVTIYHPANRILASGFYIGNGIIVTAGHVAEIENLEKVIFEDGDEYGILKQIAHPDYDCGLLIINDPNKPELKFDLAEVQRGEEIFVLGNPGGLTFISTKGMVGGRVRRALFGDVILVVSNTISASGSSGSTVIDKDGDVRGVHVGWAGTKNFTVYVPSNKILEALRQAELEIE
jgi:S1-C subfamily serine protease